jgi:FkbH-like protein
LEMTLTVRRFNAVDRSRIVQLVNKTNQFNLTTRRYSVTEIAAIETSTDHLGLTARLADRHGDDGLISVIILRAAAESWDIETWLMSCRVLGRRIENAMLNVIAAAAASAKARDVIGRYLPTAKNALVQNHYSKLGFVGDDRDGDAVWRLSLDGFTPTPSLMEVDVEDGVIAPLALTPK